MTGPSKADLVLALDTSNEVIAVGLGSHSGGADGMQLIEQASISAHRASNTMLIPTIQGLLESAGVSFGELGCVAVGRGPGSFTGVRIAMSTAKGIASALEIPLVGVSTQEAVAWGAWLQGNRGKLLVVGDAMRKEVYPAFFDLSDSGVARLSADRVAKAAEFAEDLAGSPADGQLMVAGDALFKYRDLLEGIPDILVLPEGCWTPSGAGLLLALESTLVDGIGDLSSSDYDPIAVLPVYTRLSDAEENERIKLASSEAKDLRTGVQGDPDPQAGIEVDYRPMGAEDALLAAAMEESHLGSDAWSQAMIADELGRRDRTWWVASANGQMVGYAGARIVGDDMELLKVVVSPSARRRGIGLELLAKVSEDARNLGAETASLEVRASNDGAVAFYETLGFASSGRRPKYYSDGEDALIMQRDALPIGRADATVAEGAPKSVPNAVDHAKPIILAIESSCDETAASIIDGDGRILSDIVSSQIEFHARFGGVVPEIASRKHVEAIVGVVRAALQDAGLSWGDLDAVAATYAPGLVGALVVGVAFAKGAACALGIPFIRVNHLEGHLYANKMAAGSVELPAVASLLSGGNTLLVLVKEWGSYEILGSTIDDAVGEAFDKVAKALGLPYPGGPQISKRAELGDPEAVVFPRALMHSGDYRFSLSGLKTAVINHIDKVRTADGIPGIPDICASFQQAVVDVQVSKAKRAIEETGAKSFCLGGGVAANPVLRHAYEDMCSELGITLLMPPLSACGDNAAMIALVALERYENWAFSDMTTDVEAHSDLAIPY